VTRGLPDDSTHEIPKHVGNCASIVFTSQCMQDWFDEFKKEDFVQANSPAPFNDISFNY